MISRLSTRSLRGQARAIVFLFGEVRRNSTPSPDVVLRPLFSCTHVVGAYAKRPPEIKNRGQSVIPGVWGMFQADWNAHPPVLIIDLSTKDPSWFAFPMTRFPVLPGIFSGYRVGGVSIAQQSTVGSDPKLKQRL